ncbi:DUF4349 domain-containing protein [Pedococcus sp. 2YAF34]|uniref:DUF4349 domain-containing protein n=1 Tax=Pedococcus sp. 2YAF34 TaxID=3233032 RepID=UPI003F97708A
MFRDRPPHTVAGLAAVLLASAALAACSSGSDSSASSVAGRAAVAPSPADGGAKASNGGSGSDAAGSSAGAPESGTGKPGAGSGTTVSQASLQAAQESLARRASVALQVKDIGQAVARVRAVSAAADGIVLSENIGTVAGDTPVQPSARVTATTYGEITISVPSTKLDAVVADLAQVGTVIRSTSSSEDVGSQIVDTQSRLETMRISVDRVRGYLADAKDLTQTVAMEAELTRREADLEALEAQLASLKGSVARSPVQVSLTTQPDVIVPKKADDTGFLAGLRSGWHAFAGSVTVVLTVVGAVVPFAVLFALVGLPLWWVVRRRRPAPVAPATLPQ